MLADNVVHFARILRHAGVPVGPDRVLAALDHLLGVGRYKKPGDLGVACCISRLRRAALGSARQGLTCGR